MVIAVDLDEVLADTTPVLIRYHNDVYGTSLVLDDFQSYEWWNVWGGTREQSVQKFLDFVKSPYFQEVKPVKGSQNAIIKLKESHSLHIITSRQTELEPETSSWVSTYFSGLFDGLHLTNHAQWALKGKTQTKLEVCRAIQADLLIEDSLVYAKECEEKDIPVLLLDYPWNRGALPTNTRRVHSWDEVLQNIAKS